MLRVCNRLRMSCAVFAASRHPQRCQLQPRAVPVRPRPLAYPATMTITFTPADPTGNDRAALIALLTENAWPFHMRPHPTAHDVEEAIDAGAWNGEDNTTFWIDHAEHGRVGMVRLEDLTDPTPLFDLRVAERFRGRGLGAQILAALTRHVFETMPAVDRFEGQTREDNIPMLRAFRRAGWVKEAHYRRGWPVEGGEPLASVAYAVLRQDWETGTTTPVPADVDVPSRRKRDVGAESNGHIPDWPMRTERLTLRPHREDDLGWLQEMYAQPEVVRHLLDEPWDEPNPPAEAGQTNRVERPRRPVRGDVARRRARRCPRGGRDPVADEPRAGRRRDRLGPGSASRRPGLREGGRGGDAGAWLRSPWPASGGGADGRPQHRVRPAGRSHRPASGGPPPAGLVEQG